MGQPKRDQRREEKGRGGVAWGYASGGGSMGVCLRDIIAAGGDVCGACRGQARARLRYWGQHSGGSAEGLC